MNDKIEIIGNGSVIQHGKHNDRLYLMKLKIEEVEFVLDEISKIAYVNKYGKMFCKIPRDAAPLFFANGYILEAIIPRFYNNAYDVFFMSKFFNSDRSLNIEKDKLQQLHCLFLEEREQKVKQYSESGYKIRKLDKSDAEKIVELYKGVFKSYPFPIFDPEYIQKTMTENIQYFGVEKEGELAALASSEIDFEGKNAEMTDFATHKLHVGKKLSHFLLNEMEKEMKKQAITTLYTIARVNSIAMNKTFWRSGYQYSGTLIKNTNIAGEIESMNIYYKYI